MTDRPAPNNVRISFLSTRSGIKLYRISPQVKIEKYYVPMFEVFVRMPSFHFDTDAVIEANVNHEFTFDKLGYGEIRVRWFAKKIDYSTPLFNDTYFYREEFAYYRNLTNTYRSALYDTK